VTAGILPNSIYFDCFGVIFRRHFAAHSWGLGAFSYKYGVLDEKTWPEQKSGRARRSWHRDGL
jgi:hypothetical protein